MSLLFLLALVACSFGADPFTPGETGQVTEVPGALTLTVDTGESVLEVRLAELDAPDEALSRSHLEAEAAGRAVRLAYAGQERDRYGRALAQVHVQTEGGSDVWLQARLVEAGVARVLSHADNRAAARDLLVLEGFARSEGRGLWADPAHAVRDTHPDALAQDIGSVQLVEGRVLEATQLRSGRIYLNFGADYRTDFTVMIEAEDAPAFIEAGLGPDALETRRIRVRGWIEDENGPMIRIDHPERIEVLVD
ncbi:MAG: thermonuclease family protein [Pseudomonadota bacterium]|jgi:endonuclease YncB( thermonuclease family)|nr:thermonuclease family protein [Pseudomonadota bacterium]